MLNEQWSRWEPQSNLATQYILENFVDGLDCKFEITLTEALTPHKKLLVKFEHNPYMYKNSNIEYKQKTLKTLQELLGQDFTNWAFFKVSNSNYIEWVVRHASGIYEANKFIHFVFVTRNSMIEIIDFTDVPAPLLIPE